MEDIMNGTVMLMTILVVGGIILGILALKYPNPKDEKIKVSTPTRPKKSVKLFTQDGVLLYEYKDVYLTRWDVNIYFLSYTCDGESFLRIDKGADMLLLAESYMGSEEKEYTNI